jgi:3-(3-hydroxy-phenyl)propionate hydroxylase
MSSSLVEAQFVIGADGYESFVRSALGADNVIAGTLETFAMFEGPAFPSSSCLELSFESDLTSAIYPLADARARWGFQIASALDRQPDLELLQTLLEERVSWLADKPEGVDWSIVTHFERRVARHFGRERVWLAGDAAHVTHPFGGQSMNGGLNEAHDLVERMAECLFAKKPLATLEQWGAEREREWHKLLGLHAAIESKPGAPPWLADQAARIIPTLPASGRDLQHLLRELGLIVR